MLALPLTLLSPPPRIVTLARARDRESRQGRHPVARVNERPEKRPGVPSILRRPLPRRCPLGHPALAYPGAMALPPRYRLSTSLHPSASPLLGAEASKSNEIEELGPRPRTPLPPGARFSEPRRRPLTSATEFDARTHPTSCRSSHASKGFHPATDRYQTVRLRRPHGALPHRGPASRDLHREGFRHRVPLAWTEQFTGRSSRAKASALS